ncbi:MAG: hypothetical protein ORN54_10220 [Cyclobacteriaceae bacterium]|nr:hypothetical protein [Cyclobacteriaceae bacterium]
MKLTMKSGSPGARNSRGKVVEGANNSAVARTNYGEKQMKGMPGARNMRKGNIVKTSSIEGVTSMSGKGSMMQKKKTGMPGARNDRRATMYKTATFMG